MITPAPPTAAAAAAKEEPRHRAVSRDLRGPLRAELRDEGRAKGAESSIDSHLAAPAHRERLFPPTETLSMFLAQALSADDSCQKAVDDTAIRRVVASLPVCSTHMAYSLSEVLAMMSDIAGYDITVKVNPAFVRTNEVKRLVANL